MKFLHSKHEEQAPNERRSPVLFHIQKVVGLGTVS